MSDKTDNTKKTPLSTMLESGVFLVAQGKKYKISPIKMKDIDEFLEDNLFVSDNMLLNLTNPEPKKKLDKWLSRQVKTYDDVVVTLKWQRKVLYLLWLSGVLR